MVYRANILRRLAITQMVFGVLMFVFGIASIFAAEHWTSYIAFGVWVGVWVSFDQLFRIIGTLSKPIRQRQWGRGRTKDLMGRTIASTCLLKLCSFHSRPLQNDNVESQKFASSASGNRDGKLFLFPFGTQRCLNVLCWSWVVALQETVNSCDHFRTEIHFLIDVLLGVSVSWRATWLSW